MAIDNSLYDSLENTYMKMQDYFATNKLGPEHSVMIIKHEELSELLERLDIEAIEEQSTEIHALHDELNRMKDISNKIVEDLANDADSTATPAKVVDSLDEIFSRITTMIV